jgi:hypothetical protein
VTDGGETTAAAGVIGDCAVGAAVWTGTLAGRWAARVEGGATTGAAVGTGAAGGGAAGADGADDGGA